MQIRPLYDRIVVERSAEPTKSAGGLFLPESASEKPLEGKVIAVGAGRVGDDGEVKELAVKVGDIIAFGKYAGTEIKIGGAERLVLREDEVFGVVTR